MDSWLVNPLSAQCKLLPRSLVSHELVVVGSNLTGGFYSIYVQKLFTCVGNNKSGGGGGGGKGGRGGGKDVDGKVTYRRTTDLKTL